MTVKRCVVYRGSDDVNTAIYKFDTDLCPNISVECIIYTCTLVTSDVLRKKS